MRKLVRRSLLGAIFMAGVSACSWIPDYGPGPPTFPSDMLDYDPGRYPRPPYRAKLGFVLSPYALNRPPVDVRDIFPGTRVRCPYTGRTFIVPLPGQSRGLTPEEFHEVSDEYETYRTTYRRSTATTVYRK